MSSKTRALTKLLRATDIMVATREHFEMWPEDLKEALDKAADGLATATIIVDEGIPADYVAKRRPKGGRRAPTEDETEQDETEQEEEEE